jgi:hypothetical protein
MSKALRLVTLSSPLIEKNLSLNLTLYFLNKNSRILLMKRAEYDKKITMLLEFQWENLPAKHLADYIWLQAGLAE